MPDCHRVIATKIETALVAEKMVCLSFVLKLRSELLGDDMNVGTMIYERADLIVILHLLILHLVLIFDYNILMINN